MGVVGRQLAAEEAAHTKAAEEAAEMRRQAAEAEEAAEALRVIRELEASVTAAQGRAPGSSSSSSRVAEKAILGSREFQAASDVHTQFSREQKAILEEINQRNQNIRARTAAGAPKPAPS